VGVKRKQHSTEFKARVAMASLSGEKTLTELSAEFGVHPTTISNWKQELVKRASELFARGSKSAAVEDAQKVIDDLHRKIGQLQGRARFSCRAARHLPSAERRAMIAPEAGLSVRHRQLGGPGGTGPAVRAAGGSVRGCRQTLSRHRYLGHLKRDPRCFNRTWASATPSTRTPHHGRCRTWPWRGRGTT
jgi:transposase